MAKTKRKLSAYNRHMSREMKRGKTFKQAVASWKKPKRKRPFRKMKRIDTGIGSRSKVVRRTNRRNKPMAKRQFLSTSTLMKFARIGALVAPAAAIAMGGGDPQTKIKEGVKAYAGYDMDAKKFELANLARGWLPFIGTSLVTVGISKLNGIIRRL